MNLWESLKTAAQSIFSNKMRSSLTMLGIVIGVCSVVLLVALGDGFQTSFTKSFESMGASALYVQMSSDKTLTTARELTFDDYEALTDKVLAPSLAAVSPTLSRGVNIAYGNSNVNLQCTGIMPDITKIRTYDLLVGRLVTDDDIAQRANVVTLGFQTAQDLFGNENDAMGKNLRIAGDRFTVVGVIQKMGGFSGDSYILIPLTTMQSKITGGQYVQQIAVKATSPDKVDSAISEITSILRVRHYIRPGASDDFTIRDMREMLNSMLQQLAIFSVFMALVGGISLVVGSIGIMNIMLVSVSERTREIGIRKAIGAKRRDILFQFLIESAALSLTGGLIGLLFAVIASLFLSNIQMGGGPGQPRGASMSAQISAGVVIVALMVSIFVGLISGTYPALRAARMDPIESLRHE
jgi:putative ABC transport system permease protein